MKSFLVAVHHQQFSLDMEAAGFDVREYNGRFFYHGPAAVVDRDQLQDAIRATGVPLQWDNMGRDWIVYPA